MVCLREGVQDRDTNIGDPTASASAGPAQNDNEVSWARSASLLNSVVVAVALTGIEPVFEP